jgi:hypothetical protein
MRKRRSKPTPLGYSMCLPVWFRSESETEWHTGLTRHVSATGALIRADEPSALPEHVIVAIGLPSVAGCLVGSGRVVRILASTDDVSAATFAVEVSHYRLDRCDAVLRRTVH